MYPLLAHILIASTLVFNAGVIGRAVSGNGINARPNECIGVDCPVYSPFFSRLHRRIEVPIVEAPPVDPAVVVKPADPVRAPETGPARNPAPGNDAGTGPGTGPGQNPGAKSGQESGADPNKPDPNQPNQVNDPNDENGIKDTADDPEAPICKRVDGCVPDSGSKPINHQNRVGPDINYDQRFKDHYDTKENLDPASVSDSVLGKFQLKQELDFEKESKWKRYEVRSAGKVGPKDVVNDAFYNTHDNAIIGYQRYTERDVLKKGDPDRVPSAELQWQKMKELKGGNMHELKWVGDTYIFGDTTRTKIRELNLAKGEKGTKFVEYSPDEQAYKDLSELDNAKGYFYMLGDHHEETGGLKVMKIWAANGRGDKAYLLCQLGREPQGATDLGIGTSGGTKRPASDEPALPPGAPKQPKVGGS